MVEGMCNRWLTAAWLAAALVACGGETAQQVESEPKADEAPPAKKAEPEPQPVVDEPEPEPAPTPKTPGSMEDAEAQAVALYDAHRETFLCGCRYAKTGRVSPASCGYRTRADEELARYVKWGHVVPPHDFGGQRECWTKPLCTAEDGHKFRGIECCQASDPQFAAMRADLFNLVPMVGELAWDRSNYAFGEIEGEARLYGSCDVEIDRDAELVEPGPEVRGDIARTYLYLADTYPGALPLSVQQRASFQAWAAEDPPDAWEQQRATAIAKLQGVAPAWLSELPPLPEAETPDATEDAGTKPAEVATKDEPTEQPALPPGQAAG